MGRRGRLGGFVVALALVMSACGGDGKKPAGATASSSGSASESTATSSGDSTAAVVDACKLSESDVSSIVAFTVVKETASLEETAALAAGTTDCRFRATLLGGGDALAGAGGPFAGYFATYEFRVTPLSGNDAAAMAGEVTNGADEIPGVGDKAIYLEIGGSDSLPGNGLVILAGKSQIVVTIAGHEPVGDVKASEPDPARRDKLIALAKKLLS